MTETGSAVARLPSEEPGYDSDPTGAAEQVELRTLALASLRDMLSHYRTARFLQLALQSSVEEIAAALERSVPATKSTLYRGHRSMCEGVAEYLERSPRSCCAESLGDPFRGLEMEAVDWGWSFPAGSAPT